MRAHKVLVFLLNLSRGFVNLRVYKNPYKLVLQNACENDNCINSYKLLNVNRWQINLCEYFQDFF